MNNKDKNERQECSCSEARTELSNSSGSELVSDEIFGEMDWPSDRKIQVRSSLSTEEANLLRLYRHHMKLPQITVLCSSEMTPELEEFVQFQFCPDSPDTPCSFRHLYKTAKQYTESLRDREQDSSSTEFFHRRDQRAG